MTRSRKVMSSRTRDYSALRLTGQSVNGDVADIALGPEHYELIDELPALFTEALIDDRAAHPVLHHLVNDLGGKQRILGDNRGGGAPADTIRIARIGCGR